MSFKMLTQLQLLLSTVHFFELIFINYIPYLTQFWVETTQDFLECIFLPYITSLKKKKCLPKIIILFTLKW